MAAVTVHQLAAYRRGEDPPEWTMGDYERLDLPMLGGCEVCGASIAAYNACPSKTGFLRCANGCIADQGWDTAPEADVEVFGSRARTCPECGMPPAARGTEHATGDPCTHPCHDASAARRAREGR